MAGSGPQAESLVVLDHKVASGPELSSKPCRVSLQVTKSAVLGSLSGVKREPKKDPRGVSPSHLIEN